jgi:hypothetical protein
MTGDQLKPNQVQRGLNSPEPVEIIVILPGDALAAKAAISDSSTLSRFDRGEGDSRKIISRQRL